MSILLFFGDQTDSWIEGLERLHQQAQSVLWFQDFLNETVSIVKKLSKEMDTTIQESLGHFDNLLELGDRYRFKADQIGMVQAVLLHIVRAGTLLLWVKQEPQLVNRVAPAPEALGISGGLMNTSTLAISTDFESLYIATLKMLEVFIRLCKFTSERSRVIENRPGVWGWAVLGIAPLELEKELEKFQSGLGIPLMKRAKVSVTSDHWNTVIGPPSVLDLIMSTCPVVKDLAKNDLNIHALQHFLPVSTFDLDSILGDSALLDRPVDPEFRLWGMNNPHVVYADWRQLLRAVCLQSISLPLDIARVAHQITEWLSCPQLEVKVVGPSSHVSYFKKKFNTAGVRMKIETDTSLVTVPPSSARGIAIVGMAGKGPGIETIRDMWDILMSQRDVSEEIPADRFHLEEFHGTASEQRCKTDSRFGCFMKNPGDFDTRFFHISPREALLMDPGHRQFLMSTYEALEMAGYTDSRTRAVDPTRIGTFYGQSSDDWHVTAHHHQGCDAYTLQGTQRAFGAGRPPFRFKWEGPSYSLDSACSSSASALHLARMHLNNGEIDMAVVGAANIVAYPHSWVSLSKAGVLSNSGNCKPYREDADGYCRADFVGTVVLKRVTDAVLHNDNILTVISSSGRNHSGSAGSMTAGDIGAQERLFQKVFRSACVSPDDITYVEMHATGTQVGDATEMKALCRAVENRSRATPLLVGSIKGNLGHSEAAAGMPSLLKGVLMFENNTVPPQIGMPNLLNSEYPNISEFNIGIPSKAHAFRPQHLTRRRMLLNNFDAAGGNTCILLEDFPTTSTRQKDPRSSHIVVISAATPASLKANKSALLRWLKYNPTARLEDIAYTTTARRMHHSYRTAAFASSIPELITSLEKESTTSVARNSPVVFVFSGQGSHYAGMGCVLYENCPVFRDTVDLCVSLCEQHKFPAFSGLITDPDTDISMATTAVIQLAVVTLEASLAAFWRSCGVQPAMVIGHSLGEYTALYIAGVLSLADMLYVVGSRALLIMERCDPGACAMLALPKSPQHTRKLLDSLPYPSLSIACVNAPEATVVSGSTDDIDALKSQLQLQSPKLKVEYGFHSFQMDSILDDFTFVAEGLHFHQPKVPVASTLSGAVVESDGYFDADYLARQTRNVVDFAGALRDARARLGSSTSWLGIGPD